MKRSEINQIMKDSLRFMQKMNFYLPPFAFWSPAEWKRKGPECREIVTQQMGWDITDFGSGDFKRIGLFLFTIRNGTISELSKINGKVYAEKILIVQENQITPTHFHFQKMEDIINRGGGELVIRLWNSTPHEKLAKSNVTVSCDGVNTTVKAGGTVVLKPGASICLPSHLYHEFWGKKGAGPILVGEVSRVNDDHIDNRFYKTVGRFSTVEEDEAPLYLLYNDYKNHYAFYQSALDQSGI
ncbi:MAG: D-lyxose/D-mannose family sugar isomerase [Verrucomicrobia bacterium]|nr:D-lyxose/D-mannose family sugar isomerase [Verrucomicrobiota bacterium]MCG2679211.1 D-lyxose/D-mannose family sugar isomerase [Kiritimatiellia bacterium]MBU4248604.1 D-lyxose/D-mannose family sugar isomerase [Verrucomicrobiota bacterium]MBU4290066.1 D-lyxose/D-mannose family sugar isomerase [Verrucomicrobiota bacterium]MBU4430342.1 D-lyxose/D-mannose family sugar isomerase [Verrucomicrobiota bacterium]